MKSLRDHARWYRPGEGRVTYYWPGEAWEQALVDFVPGTRTMTLGWPLRRKVPVLAIW